MRLNSSNSLIVCSQIVSVRLMLMLWPMFKCDFALHWIEMAYSRNNILKCINLLPILTNNQRIYVENSNIEYALSWDENNFIRIFCCTVYGWRVWSASICSKRGLKFSAFIRIFVACIYIHTYMTTWICATLILGFE